METNFIRCTLVETGYGDVQQRGTVKLNMNFVTMVSPYSHSLKSNNNKRLFTVTMFNPDPARRGDSYTVMGPKIEEFYDG